MFGFGWMELLLILIIVLIVFGAGKLPQLGEGIGKAITGFKKSVHDTERDEAAQPHAEPRTTVSEIMQDSRSSPGQQSLPPQGKDMVGGEEQHLTRQG